MSDAKVIMGLRTILYRVTDIDKAKDWYSSILGIEPYFADVGGFELGLEPCDELQGQGGVVGYWGVASATDALQHLVSKGAVVNEDVADVGGGIKVATVKDPWGNLFGVVENPHFNPNELS
jgi:predicted enzyme related to lactoylglutathione lyase